MSVTPTSRTALLPLADDDLFWVISCVEEDLWRLLKNPREFVEQYEHWHSLPQKVEFAQGPVFITFQFDASTPVSTYMVHGVSRSNIVSIRCPHYDNTQEYGMIKIPVNPIIPGEPVVNVVALGEGHIAFAHYDPVADSTASITLPDLVAMVTQPTRFMDFLNKKAVTVALWQGVPGALSTVDWKISFRLGPHFRFRFEAQENVPSSANASDQTMQCTKFAGTYTAYEDEEVMVMEVDEAWQTKWS